MTLEQLNIPLQNNTAYIRVDILVRHFYSWGCDVYGEGDRYLNYYNIYSNPWEK